MAEYIKRETAMQAFLTEKPDAHYPGWYAGLLEELPAADVAPVVHGRWITWEEAGNDIPSPHRHECSACHDAAQALINGIELLSDYCPNCGARMDADTERSNT